MHVEVTGRGSPLVLLHGWGLNRRVFEPFLPELGKDHRVLLVDLPGHGRSPWDARAATLGGQAALVHEGVCSRLHAAERFTAFGWSLGGQIALELAASDPRRVERLVLVATTPRFTACDDWAWGMNEHTWNAFAQHLAHDWRATVSDFLELQVRGSLNAARVLRSLQAAVFADGEPQPEALAAGLSSLARTDLRARLANIEQPALVIAGQYDRITPPPALLALAGALAHGRHLEVRRAGHAPFLSHAHEVGQAVRGFLA